MIAHMQQNISRSVGIYCGVNSATNINTDHEQQHSANSASHRKEPGEELPELLQHQQTKK
jgi:hypothetical protein